MELRCVVGVIRHGDRTPKQKMKLEVKHPKFFEIFQKYSDGHKYAKIKLKKPQQLQEILDIARELLEQIDRGSSESELIEEKKSKLEQIKHVLEMYGHFSGINRKVQLRYQPKGRPRNSSSDDGESIHMSIAFPKSPDRISSTETPKEPSLLLILKWGGELTPSGRVQAEELGKVFRCMYPGGQDLLIGGLPPIMEDFEKNRTNTQNGEYAGTQGLGLLRLHSTYRHDLKIYASDEGRVQMTAAAFAKGLLALEGELTPILVQMVKSANTNGLLDNESDCSSKYQNAVKAKLHGMMQMTKDFTPEEEEKLNPCSQISITNAIKFIKNPVNCCNHMYKVIQILNADIAKNREKQSDSELYHGETWELMARRWGKLEKDFLNKSGLYDISKVPDIFDCIKYDLQHNRKIFNTPEAEELYLFAKNMADVVIPQEYGMTRNEKLAIAQGICAPLLRKIRADLQRNIEADSFEEENDTVNRLNPRYSSGVSSPGRHVRTRLYFTSESHIHSLLTILSEGGLVDRQDEQWQRAMDYVSLVSELNYMTQVVIMLYEDPTKDPTSDQRFHVELHFSPGVNCCVKKELPPGPGFRPHSRNNEHGGSGGNSSVERSQQPSREESSENAPSTPLSPMMCSVDCSGGDLGKIFGALDLAAEEDTLLNNTGQSIKTTTEPISIDSSDSSAQSSYDNQHGAFSNQKSNSYVNKRSKCLEKKGSRPRSLDCGSDSKVGSSPSSHNEDPPSKSQSMDEVGDEEFTSKGSTTTQLFSTAVISGSSSAPNLKEMSPVPGTSIVNGSMPTIRPLETLHNALSLRQLDEFLEYVTSADFKTPTQSPPLRKSSKSSVSRSPPPPLKFMSPANSFNLWSNPPSFVSSSTDTSPAPMDFFNRIRLLALQQEQYQDSLLKE